MFDAFRRLWSRSAERNSKSRTQSRRRAFRSLEALEHRNMLTTFTVSNLSDHGVGSLRQAILNANATTTADKIIFSVNVRGNIKLTTGQLNVTEDLTIDGPGASVLSVSGNGASRVFSNAANTKLRIDDLTIRRGSVVGDGGGLLNAGEMTLNRVVVKENATSGSDGGGGIANIDSGELTMTRCTVIDNRTSDDGGGIWTGDNATSTINLSTITGNRGGASDDGGGIYNEGTTTVRKSTISYNIGIGSSFFGAGIANTGSGVLKVFHSTVHGNTSQGRGGGIYSGGSSVSLINSTIANNTSLGNLGGGGVRVIAGDINVNNCTITGNVDASESLENAGGISVTGAGTFTMNNTVVAGNFLGSGDVGPPDIRGTLTAGSSGNFIGIGTVELVGIVNGIDGNQIGTTAVPIDPLLGPLQDNGGPTFTLLPRANSPLLNVGVNSVVPAGLTIDQRGLPRITDGTVDIGAVERG
jgi:hypothetical protein